MNEKAAFLEQAGWWVRLDDASVAFDDVWFAAEALSFDDELAVLSAPLCEVA